MAKWKQFFVFCSGIDPQLLEKCPSDTNKYIGIGATVLFTGILAFFSGGYALLTIFDSWVAAIFFGLVWGLMIFNLDRYIVSSMKRKGSWTRDFFMALPRIAFAILLAIVISTPLELKIFEKEIESELILMEQETFMTQEDQVKERFERQKTDYLEEKKRLENEILDKTNTRDELALQAIAEADGTGGSLRRNMGPIYRIKKQQADQAQSELNTIIAQNEPQISDLDEQIRQIDQTVNQEIASLDRSTFGGLAARLEALDRLSSSSRAIELATMMIMLLFIAIECAPIFVKLISPRSPYDYLLHELEHVFSMQTRESRELLTNRTQNKLALVAETSTFRTKAHISAENELIEEALRQRVEKLKERPLSWSEIFLRKGIL